jgi:glycine oxidase
MADSTADVIVVGAGVIGLGIAWRCRQRGLDVTIIDVDPQAGAWRTAAGMLAPVTELHYGESDLLRLNVESAARYPDFAGELEQATGLSVGYRPTGTLALAWDGADLGALRDLHKFQRSLGLDAELLTGRELRKLEPALAPGLPGALLAAGDHSVDNRLLHKALLAANAPVRRGRAVRVDAHEVEFEDGNVMTATDVVLATGAWSGGLRPETSIRPVKGQTVRVRAAQDVLSRVVRASVKGSAVYLVPRTDGTIVIGASSEECGFDQRPRAGAVYELLRDAQSILPALSEAELIEVSTGFRPGSPDNAPLIGRAEDGLIVASGHYRNGILLTPVTADGIAALIVDGVLPPHLEPFHPERFGTGVPG